MFFLLLTVLALTVAIIVVRGRAMASHDWRWAIVERALWGSALVWAVGVSVYLVLVPIYDGVSVEGAAGDVFEQAPTGERTLLEVNGSAALVPLLIPVVLTALPWLTSNPRTRQRLQLAGSAFLLVFVVLGALSVGLLYAPSAMAMLVAMALSAAQRGQR